MQSMFANRQPLQMVISVSIHRTKAHNVYNVIVTTVTSNKRLLQRNAVIQLQMPTETEYLHSDDDKCFNYISSNNKVVYQLLFRSVLHLAGEKKRNKNDIFELFRHRFVSLDKTFS